MFIRRKDYEELLRIAYYDLATGFNNRNWFEKNFVENSPKEKISLAAVDINNLKHVNDTLGHAAGDKKIIEIGKILEKHSKVIRWGGDEFYCIINKGEEEAFENMSKNQNEYAYSIARDIDCKNIIDVLAELDEKMYICKFSQKKAHHYSPSTMLHIPEHKHPHNVNK